MKIGVDQSGEPVGQQVLRDAEVVVQFGEPMQAPEDAAQDQMRDPFGMPDPVDQRQRRPPGSAEDLPLFDFQVFANCLHVADQVPCGVLFEAGIGRTQPTASLMEHDDAVSLRVVVSAVAGITATTPG